MSEAVVSLPANRMSKSALCSLIFGVLGCIPFLSGVLAVLLGIIGFVKTRKPGVTGRWMAIVGGILGVVSLVAWTMFWGVILATLGVVIAATSAPREASHAFLKDMAAGNVVAAEAKTSGMSQMELQAIADSMAVQGKLEDTTFFQTNITNDRASLEGVATFAKGKQRVKMELRKDGADWKVMEVEIKP